MATPTAAAVVNPVPPIIENVELSLRDGSFASLPRSPYKIAIYFLIECLDAVCSESPSEERTKNIFDQTSAFINYLLPLPDMTYPTLAVLVQRYVYDDIIKALFFRRVQGVTVLGEEFALLSDFGLQKSKKEFKIFKNCSIIGYFLKALRFTEVLATPDQDFTMKRKFKEYAKMDIIPFKAHYCLDNYVKGSKATLLKFLKSFVEMSATYPNIYPAYYTFERDQYLYEVISHSCVDKYVTRQIELLQFHPSKALDHDSMNEIMNLLKVDYEGVTKIYYLLILNNIRGKNFVEAEHYIHQYFPTDNDVIVELKTSVPQPTLSEKKPFINSAIILSRLYRKRNAKRKCLSLIDEGLAQSHATRDSVATRACTLEKIMISEMDDDEVEGDMDAEVTYHRKFRDDSLDVFHVAKDGVPLSGMDEKVALEKTITELDEKYPMLNCPEFNFVINSFDKGILAACLAKEHDSVDAEAYFKQMAKQFLYIKSIQWVKKGKYRTLVNVIFEKILAADFGPDRFMQQKLLKDAVLVAMSSLAIEKGYFNEGIHKAGLVTDSMESPFRGLPKICTAIQSYAVANIAYCCAYQGLPDQAFKIIEKYADNFPDETVDDSYLHIQLAEALVTFDTNFFGGKWAELRDNLDAIRFSSNFEHDIRLAIFDCCVNDIGTAITRINQVITKLSPKSSTTFEFIRALMVQGQMYLHIENYELAIVSFNKALDMAQEHGLRNIRTMIARRIAGYYIKIGQLDDAGAILIANRGHIEAELPILEQALYYCMMFIHANTLDLKDGEKFLLSAECVLSPAKYPLILKKVLNDLLEFRSKNATNSTMPDFTELREKIKSLEIPDDVNVSYYLV
uniref:TPR_REGION domain-containing protein n=1 Tax=Rhabditophanes sp. KR3021 TaxID=114890 RepID=A0AC35TT99_9BILA